MDGCSVEPKSVISREKRDKNGLQAVLTESTGDENTLDMLVSICPLKRAEILSEKEIGDVPGNRR